MAYKIKVDSKKCIGCGSCESVCPKSFEIKDGISIPKKNEVDKISCEVDAEGICPVQAIKIEK